MRRNRDRDGKPSGLRRLTMRAFVVGEHL